jgi:hypothetical protein
MIYSWFDSGSGAAILSESQGTKMYHIHCTARDVDITPIGNFVEIGISPALLLFLSANTASKSASISLCLSFLYVRGRGLPILAEGKMELELRFTKGP